MEVAGQHLIAASRKKVWHALNDPRTLDACFSQPNAVQRISDTAYRVGAPIHSDVTVTQSSAPDMMVLAAASNHVRLDLSGSDMGPTLVKYTLTLDQGDATRLQSMAGAFFDAFQDRVSGPDETAASGAAGVIEALKGE